MLLFLIPLYHLPSAGGDRPPDEIAGSADPSIVEALQSQQAVEVHQNSKHVSILPYTSPTVLITRSDGVSTSTVRSICIRL